MIKIRQATTQDANRIWDIMKVVIASGDTYAFSPDTSKEDMLAYWFGNGRHPYVAIIDGEIAGTFLIRDNQPGLGSHIANGAYMTSPKFRSKGVGKAMGEYSLAEAGRLGYLGMQFNIVVKTNVHAVSLWKKLGFEILAEIPKAFRHAENGLTNAYIMFRSLDDQAH